MSWQGKEPTRSRPSVSAVLTTELDMIFHNFFGC